MTSRWAISQHKTWPPWFETTNKPEACLDSRVMQYDIMNYWWSTREQQHYLLQFLLIWSVKQPGFTVLTFGPISRPYTLPSQLRSANRLCPAHPSHLINNQHWAIERQISNKMVDSSLSKSNKESTQLAKSAKKWITSDRLFLGLQLT